MKIKNWKWCMYASSDGKSELNGNDKSQRFEKLFEKSVRKVLKILAKNVALRERFQNKVNFCSGR